MQLVHNYYPHTPSSDPYLFTSKFESLPHKGELLWFSHGTPFPSFYVLSHYVRQISFSELGIVSLLERKQIVLGQENLKKKIEKHQLCLFF